MRLATRTGFFRRTLTVAAVSACQAFSLPTSPTINAALLAATSAFDARAVPEALLSAEHLLTRAAGFGCDRGALSIHKDAPLSSAACEEFERMCTQRLNRVPVQYILGDWDFRELTLTLRPPTLIPRPETEELVQLVLDAHGGEPESQDAASAFLDVGCGSGAIGLALLHSLRGSTCVGIDVSEDAVALATLNAEQCGLSQRYAAHLVPDGIAGYDSSFEAGEGAQGEGAGSSTTTALFDVIVSNPPYIPRADMAALEAEVAHHEDDRALCGGNDGLDVVRDLLRAAPRLLNPEGPRAIWLEVDTSHPPLIEGWLRDEPQATELCMVMTRWLPDAFGRPRFCEVRWRPQ